MRYVSLIAAAIFVLGIGAAEAQTPAHNRSVRITGNAKFCSETAGGRLLRCRYHTMKACEKGKARATLRCVARPS